MHPTAIEAVIFDMDGTLVDSEPRTEEVVAELLRERGLSDPELELGQFHGVTWAEAARVLRARHPALEGVPVADLLQQAFHRSFVDRPPELIPGAREALLAAGRGGPAAIVSSSTRASVEHLVDRLSARGVVDLVVCAEDCTRSKPDPQCYQIAADRLGRGPGRCLVFEDSVAGLTAARQAGMQTVAIAHGKRGAPLARVQQLADRAIQDYTVLPDGFFTTIRQGGAR